MGIFGAIGGAISSFCSSVCSSIGGLVGSLASGIGRVLSIASPLTSIVIGLVKGIAEVLGIGEKEEKPEELGLKAAKSDKKFEDFDSYDEYKSYLDKITLTREDLKKLDDPTQKFAYQAIGTGVYMQGVNERYGMEVPIGTYIKMAELGVSSGKEMKSVLDTYKEKNVNPDIEKAINSDVGRMEKKEIIGTLREGLGKLENGQEISSRLDKMMGEIQEESR